MARYSNIWRGHSPLATMAGPKPMQPMQLHWASRLWGPRAMAFR